MRRSVWAVLLLSCRGVPQSTIAVSDSGSGPVTDSVLDSVSDSVSDSGSDSGSNSGPQWRITAQNLRRGLVSVWGSSATDVWLVGGDDGQGDGPLVVHYNGASFETYQTGTEGTLWWVFGFPSGPVYLGGDGGVILRFENGQFELLPTPAETTVFGIWGADAAEPLWAVGGDLFEPAGAQVWRLAQTQDEFLVPDELPFINTQAIFKVWGCAADNVWFVGTAGTVLHWDGKVFSETPSSTDQTLFTVHVEPSSCLATAVGGAGTGVIVENTGAAWSDVTPSGIYATNGVWSFDGGGFAVGILGQVLTHESGSWEIDATPVEFSSLFLHAVWVDPIGAAWAVGSDSGGFPKSHGVLVCRGVDPLPDLIDKSNNRPTDGGTDSGTGADSNTVSDSSSVTDSGSVTDSVTDSRSDSETKPECTEDSQCNDSNICTVNFCVDGVCCFARCSACDQECLSAGNCCSSYATDCSDR